MSVRIKPVYDDGTPDTGLPGRKPALSREQREEVRRRYALYRANYPKKIAADFGISMSTFTTICGPGKYRDER